MDTDLDGLYLEISQARQAEDLFGAYNIVLPPETLLERLKQKYQEFKLKTDPKRYMDPEDHDNAMEADLGLERLYAEAIERIQSGIYGLSGYGRARPPHATKSFVVGRNTYYVGERLTEDNTHFAGYLERESRSIGEVLIKLAHEPAQNALIQNEAQILDLLHQGKAPQWKHLPFLLDRFQSGQRLGLILRNSRGFTLTEVRQHHRHKSGIDPRHAIWIVDRCLSCLGFVHRQGVVHGDINPEQIIIHPDSHNAVLCNWGYSIDRPAVTGKKVAQYSRQFASPEVMDRGQIGPWSDIYSLGKTMIWILGGDPNMNEIPDGVPTPLKRFLLSMVGQKHLQRPSDAWELWSEENRLKDELWPRKFLHFDMT